MSKRPRCLICGTGLSRKHRLSTEDRAELERAGEAADVCAPHGKVALERVRAAK